MGGAGPPAWALSRGASSEKAKNTDANRRIRLSPTTLMTTCRLSDNLGRDELGDS